jgi:MFS-type transporter involved in bile tolerance (Atg22 family)
MNPTSQPPGSKFSLGSEPNVRTLYLTLVVSAVLTLLFTLFLYSAVFGRSPLNRLRYGIFVSILPALGALLFIRLTKRFASWRGVAIVYVVLFVLFVIIQALGRLIPVYN